MTTGEWIIIGIPFTAAVFLVVLGWLEERDLRRVYKMFGTTGFYDVDERFRRGGL